MKPRIVAIIGPTASGKTSLGIGIAKRFNGEVISIDSRQVYRGMDIGTAKIEGERVEVGGRSMTDLIEGAGSKAVLFDEVLHWGIDLVDPDHEYSISDFKLFADKKIAEIVRRGHVPILVGGTGFWLQAIIDNFDLTNTKSDPALREELEKKSSGDLFHEYKQLDPEGAEMIDRDNKRKLVRALEVTKLTGKPFSESQAKGESKYDVLQIGLLVDREVLNERINLRVDEMVAKGLVDEVRKLKDQYGCEIESMTSIGYRQVCEFLEKKVSLKESVEEVKTASRQYAKRQMTWFKRDKRIQWVVNQEQALELVQTFFKQKTPSL